MTEGAPPQLKLYICNDRADARAASELQTFITSKFSNIECETEPFYAPGDTLARDRVVNAINQCDIFLFFFSSRSLNPNRSLRQHFGWKFAKVMQLIPKKSVIFFFITNPKAFPPYFVNTLNEAIKNPKNRNKVFKIQPDYENNRRADSFIRKTLIELGGQPSAGEKSAVDSYDAFISFKSQDKHIAQRVYHHLKALKYSVFYSNETLRELGRDEYHRQIDQAIEKSRNMIVVGSQADHFTSKWVEYEWRLFLGELLDDRKQGNLITVVAEDLQFSDLPISLRNRESIKMNEFNRIINYIK